MEEGVAGGGGGELLNRLPEGCIAHVISLTTPRDACRSSAVSAAFRSAAASDAVWERFLPSDLPSILSRAVDLPPPPPPPPTSSSSKKDLFFRLCHRPILLDLATKSFWLDKASGAVCYMLSARALSITWGDTPEYWAWIRLPDTRFAEVAELLDVCWLEIVGRIGCSALSPKTAYAAYLVFRIADSSRGLQSPKQETCVTLGGVESKHAVCLQPDAETQQITRGRPWPFRVRQRQMPGEITDGAVISPRARSDGWMEVEMGEFYNETGEDGEVEMSLREIRGGNWKNGLIVQGIEIRPKKM